MVAASRSFAGIVGFALCGEDPMRFSRPDPGRPEQEDSDGRHCFRTWLKKA